jgi:hypothetical protein
MRNESPAEQHRDFQTSAGIEGLRFCSFNPSKSHSLSINCSLTVAHWSSTHDMAMYNISRTNESNGIAKIVLVCKMTSGGRHSMSRENTFLTRRPDDCSLRIWLRCMPETAFRAKARAPPYSIHSTCPCRCREYYRGGEKYGDHRCFGGVSFRAMGSLREGSPHLKECSVWRVANHVPSSSFP